MSDLKSIYGIGKGSAQIVDLRPVEDFSEANRLAAEKKAAEKIAKRATKAAALDSMVNKLENEGWDRHNTFLQEKLNGIQQYVMDEIGEGGETVFADDPKKQAELKSRVNDFVSWNQWSSNLSSEANKQLARAQKNRKEIDLESLGQFNNWLNQSPEYQRANPMPRIKDRNRSLNEIMKDDYSRALGNMETQVVYEGSPDPETGEIKKSDITSTNQEEFDNFVRNISSDPNNPANIEAGEMAARFLDGEGIVGRTIINEEGEEVSNPEYLKQYNDLKEKYVRDAASAYLNPEKRKFTKRFRPTEDPSKQLDITEITENERGYTTERVPEKIRKNAQVSKVGTIGNKKYYQLANPVFIDKVSGKKYKSKQAVIDAGVPDDDIDELPIGTWIDNDYNVPKNVKDIQETTEKKTYPVLREVTVQNSPTKKVRASVVYRPDGSRETVGEGTVLEGKLVGYHKKNVVETQDRLIHEGEEGYSPDVKGHKQIEMATIKTKDGIVEVEATDQVKNTYKKEFKKISEGEPKNLTEAEYNALKSGDTFYHDGVKYTKK